MSTNSTLLDGPWARGFYANNPRYKRPFSMNGDSTPYLIERDYRCAESTYQAGLLGVEQLPFNPLYRLIIETDPVPLAQANAIATVRTFSRIPSTQITYSSQAITKPGPSVFGVAGGHYDINTTGTYVATGIVFYRYANYFFLNNEIYVIQVAATSANSGGNTRITATAHGITGTEKILFTNNLAAIGGYIVAPAYYTVVDANTIDLIGINIGVTDGGYIAKYYRAYTPGTDRVGTKLSQAFYLPGVTTGITTPADIPIPSPLLNDLELVNSLLANLTGYQTYDSTALAQWMASPIYTQTAIQINMADL